MDGAFFAYPEYPGLAEAVATGHASLKIVLDACNSDTAPDTESELGDGEEVNNDIDAGLVPTAGVDGGINGDKEGPDPPF
jgi:hypothetical protein